MKSSGTSGMKQKPGPSISPRSNISVKTAHAKRFKDLVWKEAWSSSDVLFSPLVLKGHNASTV